MDHYLAALRELVKTCIFGTTENEMLRDQIVEKTCMSHIRERLLLEPELTLDKALTLARNIETAMADAKTFTNGETEHVNSLYRQGNKTSGNQTLKDQKEEKQSDANQQCYRCGSPSHLANDQSCPAKNGKCKTSGKIGHFSRVCRSSTTSVNEVDLPEVTVLYVGRKSAEGKLMGNFTVAAPHSQSYNTDIVDTRSGASIIPKEMYMKHFKTSKLSPPTVQLLTYSKHKLRVLGRLEATITYQNRIVTGFFNVVKSGTPLIGLDLCKALEIEIKGGRLVEPPPTMECAVIPQPEPPPSSMGHKVEKEIGHAKNFVHKAYKPV